MSRNAIASLLRAVASLDPDEVRAIADEIEGKSSPPPKRRRRHVVPTEADIRRAAAASRRLGIERE